MAYERMRIFTGNANPKLAEAVCRHLNVSLGRCVVGQFSDGEVMVELLENVRGRGNWKVSSRAVWRGIPWPAWQSRRGRVQ